MSAPTMAPGKSWVFSLAAAEAVTPELKRELLRRFLTSDEDRLLALQVLREYFATACHGHGTFQHLEVATEALQAKITDDGLFLDVEFILADQEDL